MKKQEHYTTSIALKLFETKTTDRHDIIYNSSQSFNRDENIILNIKLSIAVTCHSN